MSESVTTRQLAFECGCKMIFEGHELKLNLKESKICYWHVEHFEIIKVGGIPTV